MPAEESAVPESLVTRILHEAFSLLSTRPEFDESALARLKTLAASGGLSNSAQVLQSIKPAQGDNHEGA